MNFSTKGHDIFRRWYVDGRLYYHKIIDRDSPIKGITELRYIDPRKIKKIREIKKGRPVAIANIQIVHDYNEYFLYNEKGVAGLVWRVVVLRLLQTRYSFLSKWFSRLEQKYGYLICIRQLNL